MIFPSCSLKFNLRTKDKWKVFFPSWEFDLFRSKHQQKYMLGMYCSHLYVSYSILAPSFPLEEDSLLPASKDPTLPCTRELIYCWNCNLFFAMLMHIRHDRYCTHFSGPYSNSFKSIRRLLRSKVSSAFQNDRAHGYVPPTICKIYCKSTYLYA